MREQLTDIAERLMTLRLALGQPAFETACHRARHAIATVAMETAEEKAFAVQGVYQVLDQQSSVNPDDTK